MGSIQIPRFFFNDQTQGRMNSCDFLICVKLKVLVLSAGGYGHVPIPLFKQPEETGTGPGCSWLVGVSSFLGWTWEHTDSYWFYMLRDRKNTWTELYHIFLQLLRLSIFTNDNCYFILGKCIVTVQTNQRRGVVGKALLQSDGQERVAYILHGLAPERLRGAMT